MTTFGLDIGGTKILGLAAGPDGAIRATVKVDSERAGGPEVVFERAVLACRRLQSECGEPQSIGAGFAGLVDPAAGVVQSSIMLPGFDGVPLARWLTDELSVPARVMNDAKAAGFGEFCALGRPQGLHLVLLTVGTGIGGAIFIDGRPYLGAAGFAGEFGNASIDYQGETCWCGSRGCLNMLASGSALAAHAARAALADPSSALHGRSEPLTVEAIGAAAAAGDALARRVLADGAAALGAGIANVINILNPHRVSLTGGVIELGPEYLEQVRREARARAFRELAEVAAIEPAVLGYRTGAYGAAMLARELVRAPGARA